MDFFTGQKLSKYGVNFQFKSIQSKQGKIRTRKNSVFGLISRSEAANLCNSHHGNSIITKSNWFLKNKVFHFLGNIQIIPFHIVGISSCCSIGNKLAVRVLSKSCSEKFLLNLQENRYTVVSYLKQSWKFKSEISLHYISYPLNFRTFSKQVSYRADNFYLLSICIK